MIADKIMGFLGPLLGRWFPDATTRLEREAELRMAVVAGASVWGPLGWGALISVVGLVAYTLSVAWLNRPFIYDIALILMLIPTAAFGIDLQSWLKARREWTKQRKDERRN